MNFKILTLLIFHAASSSAQISFESLLDVANHDESKLEKKEVSKLQMAYAKSGKKGFEACIESERVLPQNFKIVLELENNASVRNSWGNKDDKFTKCFKQQLYKNFTFDAPYYPFFTAFEYENNY